MAPTSSSSHHAACLYLLSTRGFSTKVIYTAHLSNLTSRHSIIYQQAMLVLRERWFADGHKSRSKLTS